MIFQFLLSYNIGIYTILVDFLSKYLYLCRKYFYMTNLTLYTTIMSLPNNVRNEVWQYIQTLLKENKIKAIKAHPKAGCMKGTFTIADNFNDPIDDL